MLYIELILPIVLYGCETWSLTLREERRLRMFENRVLRKTFGRKIDDLKGQWIGLHNEEFYDLYAVIKSRRTRRGEGGHVARMGDMRGACRNLMGIPDEKKPLVKPRHMRENNIKMNLQ